MIHGTCTITVYFEDPFWVGLFEREDMDGYQVSKFPFGAEPKDYEVYDALLSRWKDLIFSLPLPSERKRPHKINPKRERKEINRKLQGPPVGTKAQEAMKLQHLEGKRERKMFSRQERERVEAHKFQLRQEKKKQKHRGR